MYRGEGVQNEHWENFCLSGFIGDPKVGWGNAVMLAKEIAKMGMLLEPKFVGYFFDGFFRVKK